MDGYEFPGMTPELQAYLARGDDYRRVANESWKLIEVAQAACKLANNDSEVVKAYEESKAKHYASLQAHTEETERMRKALNGLDEEYRRAFKEWYCRDETVIGEPREVISPSGRYRLVITQHSTGPKTWNFSKGRVYEGDRAITTICRNYGSFPATFVEDHPKGDFLICGENYQGSTVIDLKTGLVASSHTSQFCWVAHHVSPSKQTLAIEGCHWACPYEVIAVDFSDPFATPLPVLMRGDAESFGEWVGPDSFTHGARYEVYLPWRKRYDDLTPEEEADVDAREAAGEKVVEEVFEEAAVWNREV